MTKPDPVNEVVEALEEAKLDFLALVKEMNCDPKEVAAKVLRLNAALPLARSQAEKAALYDSTRAALEWINKNFGHTLLGIMKLAQMARPDIYKDCPAIIKDMIEKGGKL